MHLRSTGVIGHLYKYFTWFNRTNKSWGEFQSATAEPTLRKAVPLHLQTPRSKRYTRLDMCSVRRCYSKVCTLTADRLVLKWRYTRVLHALELQHLVGIQDWTRRLPWPKMDVGKQLISQGVRWFCLISHTFHFDFPCKWLSIQTEALVSCNAHKMRTRATCWAAPLHSRSFRFFNPNLNNRTLVVRLGINERHDWLTPVNSSM